MSRTISFEGRTISVPDDATDDEVRSILEGSAPAAPAPSVGEKLNQAGEGLHRGAYWLPQKAAELGAKALDFTGLTDHAYDKTKGAIDEANTLALDNPADANAKPFKVGNVAGDVVSSAPLAALAPFGGGGFAAALGNGALQGGVGGLLSDPTSAKDAGLGAGFGAGLNGLTHGAAQIFTPVIRNAVQQLAAHGVTMSPGQIFGGLTKGVEDRFAGLPLIGDPIKRAQQQSLRDFGTGAGNIALGGLGPLPEGISGQAMSTTGHQIFNDAYDQVLPQLQVTLGAPLAQAVSAAGGTVASRLPDEMSGQFQGTLADVFKKMGSGQTAAPTNTFPGRSVKEAYSDLGRSARDYQGPNEDANSRSLGRAFGDVQEGLRQSFSAADPMAAAALRNIDTAYRGFIPIDRAVKSATGNAGGLEAGVFTPRQLRQATVAGDNSVRNMAVAQGGSPMQQYAENGIEVLPSSVADSGTAGRLTLLDFMREPHLALPALATHALYSRPVIAALNHHFALGPSPTMRSLGQLVESLGGAAAPATVLATGGGK